MERTGSALEALPIVMDVTSSKSSLAMTTMTSEINKKVSVITKLKRKLSSPMPLFLIFKEVGVLDPA